VKIPGVYRLIFVNMPGVYRLMFSEYTWSI